MISAVYACMDREANLIQSIKSWIDVPEITEFIVVDWSSSKPLISNPTILEWTQSRNLKIYRVNDQKYFSLPKAYNLAVSKTTNKIILKLDSDYKNLNSSWMKYLLITDKQELQNFYIIGEWLFGRSLSGFLLVNKKDFVMYNENFKGWGFDDYDIYTRIAKTHKFLTGIIFFNIMDYIYHIPHSDFERTMNYEIKNQEYSNQTNSELSKIATTFEPTQYQIISEKHNYTELFAI